MLNFNSELALNGQDVANDLIDKSIVGYCVREPKISIVLVYSSKFLIQACRKLPFVIPAAGVKQGVKVLGPLVTFGVKHQRNVSRTSALIGYSVSPVTPDNVTTNIM